MRREMDLVRQLLLQIEDQGGDANSWIDDATVEGYSEKQVSHHVWLLLNGGFIEAVDLSDSEGSSFRPRCLTWRGHEFLDAVRDKEIWTKTLEVAQRGGLNSLSAIFDIAKALGTKKLEKLAGFV